MKIQSLCVLLTSFAFAFAFASCSKPTTPAASKTKMDSDQAQKNSQKQTRRKAEAGVGKKGQKLKDHRGPLATPAKAMFKAEQQIMFLKVQQALTAFEILNDRYPNSHDEYMEKVIKANNLNLPELPVGQRYEFDTETHELMVVGAEEGG